MVVRRLLFQQERHGLVAVHLPVRHELRDRPQRGSEAVAAVDTQSSAERARNERFIAILNREPTGAVWCVASIAP
jgi:hypothetical protein